MLKKAERFVQLAQVKLRIAKTVYEEFRIYDLGSLAVNKLTPKKGYSTVENIAYGLKSRHRLDLYKTDKPRTQQPLIVFVHGGAWSHGDKKDYCFVGEAFAKEGFDVAVINYHLAPDHIFPVYVDDLSLALNYLDANQDKLNTKTDAIILMGHSAGAFNVLSALYHPKPYNLACRDNIKAVVGLAGPYHFDYKGDPLCEDAFDQERPYHEVMPYYFVEANQIQHYLLIAEQDTIVHLSNATDLDEALRKVGNHSEMVIVPKTGHITLIGSVSSLFASFFATKNMILDVLNKALSTR